MGAKETALVCNKKGELRKKENTKLGNVNEYFLQFGFSFDKQSRTIGKYYKRI